MINVYIEKNGEKIIKSLKYYEIDGFLNVCNSYDKLI